MSFKENLKEEITYQGLLLKEVAAKAGLPPNTISNYLRSNSSIPSVDIAYKIAKALNVSVEYLVTGSNDFSSKNNSDHNNYSAETRLFADKFEQLSPKEKQLVKVLINEMISSK